MITHNKRLIGIVAIVALLLLMPLVAMQFTNEVNWNLFDFVVAGALLLGTGIAIDFVVRTVSRVEYRIAICLTIIIALLLIWAELAVGIFGTPFAGS